MNNTYTYVDDHETEGQRMSDIGGDMADHDMWVERVAEIQGIKADRNRRVKALAGRYVVSTLGRSSNRPVFYQDQRISSGGYWTQYLSNALGFDDYAEAMRFAKTFKYGSPNVAIVTASGVYQWVNKKGALV